MVAPLSINVGQIDHEQRQVVGNATWMAQRCDEKGERVIISCSATDSLLRVSKLIFDSYFCLIHNSNNDHVRILVSETLWRGICKFAYNCRWPDPMTNILIPESLVRTLEDAAFLRQVIFVITHTQIVESSELPLNPLFANFSPARNELNNRTPTLPIIKRLDVLRSHLYQQGHHSNETTQVTEGVALKAKVKQIAPFVKSQPTTPTIKSQKNTNILPQKTKKVSNAQIALIAPQQQKIHKKVAQQTSNPTQPTAAKTIELSHPSPQNKISPTLPALPITIEPKWYYHTSAELFECAGYFFAEDFQPINAYDRRHDSIPRFVSLLRGNSILLPMSFLNHDQGFSHSQLTFMRWCRNHPRDLNKADELTLRWQLSHCYYEKHFNDPSAIFENNYLHCLVRELATRSSLVGFLEKGAKEGFWGVLPKKEHIPVDQFVGNDNSRNSERRTSYIGENSKQ